MTPTIECLVCKSAHLSNVYHVSNVSLVPNAPLSKAQLHNELFATLDIVKCTTCGLVFNAAFDASLIDKIYTDNYSSGVSRSAKNMKRYDSIITYIIRPENVAHKKIIEIGASDFAFSELLLAHGAHQVVAFEPSNLFSTADPRIVHVPTFFNAQAVPEGLKSIDLIVMRHVLEHLPDPVQSLRNISNAAGQGIMMYIEVPNVDDILSQNRFYEFFYEHVTYWTPSLLSKVMQTLGFETVAMKDLANGQHFGLLCRKVSQCDMVLTTVEWPAAACTGQNIEAATKQYLNTLERAIKSYSRVAIYGAGNHGLGIASLLQSCKDAVHCILDSNGMKQGKYAPKSHIPIMQPSQDLVRSLDAIFVIAPLHQDEICIFLQGRLQFGGHLWQTYPCIRLVGCKT